MSFLLGFAQFRSLYIYMHISICSHIPRHIVFSRGMSFRNGTLPDVTHALPMWPFGFDAHVHRACACGLCIYICIYICRYMHTCVYIYIRHINLSSSMQTYMLLSIASHAFWPSLSVQKAPLSRCCSEATTRWCRQGPDGWDWGLIKGTSTAKMPICRDWGGIKKTRFSVCWDISRI